MNGTPAATTREYPRTVTLANNATATLRLMQPADAEALVAFARSLPADDLLFLRTDITDPEVVARWAGNVGAGQTITVLAEMGGGIAGYASLHLQYVTWQRHLGEIRVIVGQRARSSGLGRVLVNEVMALAGEKGLRKLMAQTTPDQRGAIAMFERLGFQPEALLQDFVIDRAGRTRDLVVMAHDVTGLTDRAD